MAVSCSGVSIPGRAENQLTTIDSSIPRLDQTLHASSPGGGIPREQSSLQPENDVDRRKTSMLGLDLDLLDLLTEISSRS